MKNVLVTGYNGFIGRNLTLALRERGFNPLVYGREHSTDDLLQLCELADVVVHLAGENRPKELDEFEANNVKLTETICNSLRTLGKHAKFIFSSSIQVTKPNPYGESKLKAEKLLEEAAFEGLINLCIYRLPNVFGKWCKPNYNSVVATFCHNFCNDLPCIVNSTDVGLTLVHVDAVVNGIIDLIIEDDFKEKVSRKTINETTQITLGELYSKIARIHNDRKKHGIPETGSGFDRALYSTYISYLKKDDFSYLLPSNTDARGSFAEFLRTPNCGQISFFTANPGVVRGNHYHHTKTEKFLVVVGRALFKFTNILNNEVIYKTVDGSIPEVVDTSPGWAHSIENTGSDTLVVVLWANELFEVNSPDTFGVGY